MRLYFILLIMFTHSTVFANDSSIELGAQRTTDTIITVITVMVALITFGITTIIPIALRIYRRYDRSVRNMNIQIELVRRVEGLIYQYEVDVLGSSKANDYAVVILPRFTLRKNLQSLISPTSHDIAASQRLACSDLAQLITDKKSVWPRKLKSLIRFMRANGLLSNELLSSKEYKERLVKELEDFAEDGNWDRDLFSHPLSETIFKDFVYGFLVLLSILFVVALIVNGGEFIRWMAENSVSDKGCTLMCIAQAIM